jgi:hypothetical protein
MHIVLLGDSTFDNAAYVAPGEAVIDHLRRRLPAGVRATLAAIDGSVTSDVEPQLASIPADATHLVLSVGGNDALLAAGVLDAPAISVAEALLKLADIRDGFARNYATMLDRVLDRRRPTAIATIYEARFPDLQARRIAATALPVLNDVIAREAARRGLPLLDLRTMFDSEADYANAIEPSSAGGAKIAAAIRRLVDEHDFTQERSVIFAR